MQRNDDRRFPSVRNRKVGPLPAMVAAAVILGSLLAAPARAIQITSTEVVVPVAAHLPGLEGTQWRTDVWIVNPYSDTSQVTVTYYPEAGGTLTVTRQVEGYRGLSFRDIVLETFGLDRSKGMLIVASDASALEVRARIYNTGNACGEFGQAIPGIPLDRLGRQGFLSGVSTAAGTRLSFGLANPTDETLEIQVHVDDMDTGEQVYLDPITLGPHQLLQLDRVADLWDLPERDSLVIATHTSGEARYYAYASVVRNDTGDATFLFGTAPNSGPR